MARHRPAGPLPDAVPAEIAATNDKLDALDLVLHGAPRRVTKTGSAQTNAPTDLADHRDGTASSSEAVGDQTPGEGPDAGPHMEQTTDLPALGRSAELAPDGIHPRARSPEAIWSAGTRMRRASLSGGPRDERHGMAPERAGLERLQYPARGRSRRARSRLTSPAAERT